RGGKKRHYTPTATDAAGIRRKTVGWDAVHIAIDDATRLAYAEVLPDETGQTAAAFLARAVAFYARHGITIQRLLTDNGSPYRSTIHALACRQLGIRHLHTRPYRPQTNGKAERFIRTLLTGWAYGPIYANTAERTQALDGSLYHYNHHRPHQALRRAPTHHPPEQPAWELQLARWQCVMCWTSCAASVSAYWLTVCRRSRGASSPPCSADRVPKTRRDWSSAATGHTGDRKRGWNGESAGSRARRQLRRADGSAYRQA
ncbi:MAG: integrase core domain-containing protein, partial [Solirubrobacteraceae bacterium]